MSTRKLRGCMRCGGQMFREVYQESCQDCRERGAGVCGNCWVSIEHYCLQCGNVDYGPRLRRKNFKG